jgi:hypothetical protein
MLGIGCYDDEHQIFLQGLCKGILNFKENMQLMEVVLAKCQLQVSESKADKSGERGVLPPRKRNLGCSKN